MEKGTLQQIPIDLLVAHQANPNRMSKSTFVKLVRNIKKTGLYEPVVVRSLGDKFQIINGHHRIEALKKLGEQSVAAVVWDVDDNQAMILLASLNRLTGSDNFTKKSQLYNKLLANFSTKDLAKILPASAVQLERLAFAKLPDVPAAPLDDLPEAMVFFLNRHQREIVERSLTAARAKIPTGAKAKMNAEALTLIAQSFI